MAYLWLTTNIDDAMINAVKDGRISYAGIKMWV